MTGPRPAKPPRAWQRMLSGRRLDILDPSPLDIEVEDIAHGLARVARWNGQTHGPHAYSVAQHACLVEVIAAELDPDLTRAARLATLLHDAPEYVMGDLITPLKDAVGDSYRSVEARLMGAIHRRFGLPAEAAPALRRLIKRADRIAAYLEATRLAGFSQAEARAVFGQPACRPASAEPLLTPWSAEKAQKTFEDRVRVCAPSDDRPRTGRRGAA